MKTVFNICISNLENCVGSVTIKINNHLFLAVIVVTVSNILLTINGAPTERKIESANPDHCNLLKDEADEYYELVFEYRNFVENLEGMKDRVWNISGVVKLQEMTKIYYNSNSIRFQMNRAAYYIVRKMAINLHSYISFKFFVSLSLNKVIALERFRHTLSCIHRCESL